MASLPLAGYRILSLAEQYPGPYATMLLADLGADVILVERPGTGDPSRRFPGLFASFNRNKRSVALNLKSEQGRADFLQLVDSADAVIEGFRPGVMARLKIDAVALRERKPELIFVSISSVGQTGPAAGIATHDVSTQAAAGMINAAPGKEADYDVPMLPLGDIASAMFAAFGIVTALLARTKTGRGSTIDVSMLDSLVSWMTPFLVPPLNLHPTRILPPRDPGYGVFATADAQQITLSIAGEDDMWAQLCGVLDLAQFAILKETEREPQRAQILPLVREAIAQRGYAELCRQLEARGVAFGPVVALDDVLFTAQVQARRMVVEVDGPNGKQRFVRQPLLIDGQVTGLARQAPGLGEHNRELLGQPALAIGS